ncbi:MAG: MATE family efflux transporter [Methanosarcinales archaeon]|nr:MATE family efflux transporter [Methanosarcinales archaeon]
MAIMIGNLLFEIIDMFWVGRTSPAGIAALAVASYLIWALRALANVAAGGTLALISRSAGGRKWDRLAHWFWQGALLALLLSTCFSLLGFATLDAVLRFMELEGMVFSLAAAYLSIFYISLPLVFLFVFFDAVFRSLGDTFTPAAITATALALNILLDPFLIFGWMGAPAIGVPGAALATALSQGAGLLLFVWRLQREGLSLGWPRLAARGLWADLLLMARIGSPLALTGALFSLIYVFITRIVAQFGTVHIAAMGIGQRWEGLAYFACIAASTAVATLVGQNLGAGRTDRAREAVHLATRYLLAFTFLVSLAFIFAGDLLASLLTPDQAVVQATGQYLRIIGLFEVAMALELGLEGAFLGSGDTWPPFFISVPLTAARVPLAWLLAVEMGMGIDGVWLVIGITTMLKGALMGMWFLRGGWAKAKVKV